MHVAFERVRRKTSPAERLESTSTKGLLCYDRISQNADAFNLDFDDITGF